MGIKTNIDYCDSTCNLMVGCDGCELLPGHCYAAKLVGRYAGHKGWPKDFSKPELFLDRLDEALRWRDLTGTERPEKPWLNGMPRIIFLNDLGDCFTESIEMFGWLELAVDRMAKSPHVFLLLTKRPKRLAEFTAQWCERRGKTFPENVWGGTTATGQETRQRIWDLLLAPHLAVRFLSYEPAIGPLDLDAIEAVCQTWRRGATMGKYLDWVIAGGETVARERGRAIPIGSAWSAINARL